MLESGLRADVMPRQPREPHRQRLATWVTPWFSAFAIRCRALFPQTKPRLASQGSGVFTVRRWSDQAPESAERAACAGVEIGARATTAGKPPTTERAQGAGEAQT
jgi:hypothetical protein